MLSVLELGFCIMRASLGIWTLRRVSCRDEVNNETEAGPMWLTHMFGPGLALFVAAVKLCRSFPGPSQGQHNLNDPSSLLMASLSLGLIGLFSVFQTCWKVFPPLAHTAPFQSFDCLCAPWKVLPTALRALSPTPLITVPCIFFLAQ